MNKQRKTSHILNVFQYDADGHVVLPASLTLTVPPGGSDNSAKVGTTAWVRTYVSGLSYITGNQSITVSGDATGSGTTAIALTLANTAVTPGSYGSATLVPVVTVDSKGRITSVTTAAISGSLTFTGDVTGSGTTGTSTTMTLAASGVTAGTYTKVTVDSKGRVTVGASATTTDIAEGTNLYYTDARVLSYLSANTYATQSYVNTQVSNLVASAPATLDTLNELAAALGNDPSFATTISTALGNRLRVDINTQGLSATLQGYGRTNLGLGTAATSATGDFAAASHTHSIANVTGLQTALDGKQASGSYAAATHSHIISDVTGLQTALDGKQASLGFTPYNSTNPSGYISSYTETDTLASVTARGNSTSTASIFSSSLAVGNSSHYDSAQFSLDVNGGVLIKNTGKTAQLILQNANPASGGNNGFVQHLVGGTTTGAFASIQTYYGTSVAAGTLQLQPNGGSVTIGGSTVYHGGNIPTWNQNTTGTAASISGFNNPTTAATANTIVYRDGSGDITTRYFLGGYVNTSDNVDTGAITYIMAKFGDNYHRSATAAKVQSFLGLGSLAYSSATIPTNTNQLTNGSGYITGITSGNVTIALGFTPYNATNPAGYITGVTNISGNAATATYATSAGSAPNAGNLNTSYGVTAGAGYGLKFWGGSDTYKISMGNDAEYHYGPVTDYSIKTVIDSVGATRGFTWGVNGGTPVAGLNVGNGNMQIAGTFTASNYSGSHSGASSGTNTGDQSSVSGNAGTVGGVGIGSIVRKDTTSQYLKPYYEYGSYLTTESPSNLRDQMGGGGLRVDFMNNGGGGSWNHVLTWSGYNIYNMYQLGGYYDGGTGTDLYVRSEANHTGTSWTAWRKLLNSSNYTSYSPSLTGSGASGTWGISITGNAGYANSAGNSSTTSQRDFSGSLTTPTYYMGGNTAKYITNFAGSHTAIYIGGSQSAYSGFTVDGGMRVMVHTSGVGAPCGFYHESQGWSALFYVNGQSILMNAANTKLATETFGVSVTGEIRASGDITAYYSDIRLKKDIDVIPNAIEKIKQLRGVTYTWNEEEVNVVKKRSGQRDIGLIAQEVEAIEPLFTKEYQTPLEETPKDANAAANFTPRMSETYKTIKYDKLVALLVEGMKEQQIQIEELKNKLDNVLSSR